MKTPIPADLRLRLPERHQVEMRCLALDQLLPEDHPARLVWAYVEGLDLTPLHQAIRARQGVAGRDANDPRLLMALWLYATLQGVGSARQLDELCTESLPYQWLCGGVSMNYHSLADFRTEHVELLDGLLTQGVAALLHQGLVELTRVAQDGMKVRASAGQSSFRRPTTLAKCLQEARDQVAAVKAQADEDPGAVTRRQQAARARAAAGRQQRVEAALREAAQIAARQQQTQKRTGRPADPEQARASTTDPEARKMKMADGGYRPAYNVQFATATAGGVVVGVDVSNAGTDGGQLSPMAEQLERRYGQAPAEFLADGGFAVLDDIEALHQQYQAKVYAPVRDEDKKREKGEDPFAPRRGDAEGVKLWRQRMGTDEAKAIYKERAATAEWVNAGARNRGCYQVRVRGRLKVLAVALWQALAHNLLRALALRAVAAAR
jgi:transposase